MLYDADTSEEDRVEPGHGVHVYVPDGLQLPDDDLLSAYQRANKPFYLLLDLPRLLPILHILPLLLAQRSRLHSARPPDQLLRHH